MIEKFPLKTERIILNIFSKNDLTQQYVNWLNDSVVVKYSNQRFKRHTIKDSTSYFNLFKKQNALFLSIYHKKDKEMIGTMTIYFNIYHKVADIGIMLGNKSYWGQGLGKECWNTVLEFLVHYSNLRKITGGTISCNAKMIKIMESTGMKLDGIRKKQEIIDNSIYDIYYFAYYTNHG